MFYNIYCCGNTCSGLNVVGIIELPDNHPDPVSSSWGYLCQTCYNERQKAGHIPFQPGRKPITPPITPPPFIKGP